MGGKSIAAVPSPSFTLAEGTAPLLEPRCAIELTADLTTLFRLEQRAITPRGTSLRQSWSFRAQGNSQFRFCTPISTLPFSTR